MSKPPIPCTLGIAARGYSFVDGVYVKGEHGSPTKAQSLIDSQKLRESEQAKTQAACVAAGAPESVRASTPWIPLAHAFRSWPFLVQREALEGAPLAGKASGAGAQTIPHGNHGDNLRSVQK